MPAAKANLAIEQGAYWRQELVWKDGDGNPVDVTSHTARMQLRKSPSASAVVVELTTANGRITLGGAEGTILLELDASVTAGIKAGKYVYDLELVPADPERVVRLVKGKVTVSAEVTR